MSGLGCIPLIGTYGRARIGGWRNGLRQEKAEVIGADPGSDAAGAVAIWGFVSPVVRRSRIFSFATGQPDGLSVSIGSTLV
jgi:hypothetical protein